MAVDLFAYCTWMYLNMNCRKVTRKDLPIIQQWWKQRLDINFNLEILSDFGYMVDNNAALFLYPVMGSKVAWLGWPISNPETSKEDRDKALNCLFDIIHKEAKELGFKYIWTTSGVSPVQERLVKQNYVVGDTNINQYWRQL